MQDDNNVCVSVCQNSGGMENMKFLSDFQKSLWTHDGWWPTNSERWEEGPSRASSTRILRNSNASGHQSLGSGRPKRGHVWRRWIGHLQQWGKPHVYNPPRSLAGKGRNRDSLNLASSLKMNPSFKVLVKSLLPPSWNFKRIPEFIPLYWMGRGLPVFSNSAEFV